MIDQIFSIRDDFPAVDYQQWRELAEASLKGASFEKKLVTNSYEGVKLLPIYTSADRLSEGDATGLPGQPPYVRGGAPLGSVATGWDLRQEHSQPEPAAFNAAVLSDVDAGVSSLQLVFDRAGQLGLDPDNEQSKDVVGSAGLMAYLADDLDAALNDVDLANVGVSLEPGAAFLPASALLVALWQKRQVPLAKVSAAFNADPLGVLARNGHLPYSVESALAQLSDLAQWTGANCPQATAVGVDTSPYHHAGATATQDLAVAMATAAQYMRSMIESGIPADDAARQIQFRISIGTHQFLAIAKLRAIRPL